MRDKQKKNGFVIEKYFTDVVKKNMLISNDYANKNFKFLTQNKDLVAVSGE